MTNRESEVLDLLQACDVIDEATANDLRERIPESRPLLGRILLDRHWLTMHQVAKILARQADDPSSLFGQIAVELGFCSQSQIDEAWAEQRRRAPHAFELAYEHPGIDRDRLIQVLMVYVRHLEATVAELQAFKALHTPSAALPGSRNASPAKRSEGARTE